MNNPDRNRPPDPYQKVFIDSPIVIPETPPEYTRAVIELRKAQELITKILELASSDQAALTRWVMVRKGFSGPALSRIRLLKKINHDQIVGRIRIVQNTSSDMARRFAHLPDQANQAQAIVMALAVPSENPNKPPYRPIIKDLLDWMRFLVKKKKITSITAIEKPH